ncbi:MAG: hypothetical protein JWN67_29 [Actinomycetia bacterium]|nr:hypothetical protein [Actinomycetes bacterium]
MLTIGVRQQIERVTDAPRAHTPSGAAEAWSGGTTTVWSQERGDLAVVVLAPPAPTEPHVVLCRRADGWSVVVTSNQMGFLSYDGSPGPWIRETNDPLGVSLARCDAGASVTAVRCRYPDGQVVEESVVEGRWHLARWDMRMWGGGAPMPIVEAVLVDGSWQPSITPDLAMTEEDVFSESPVEMDSDVWALFDHLNDTDPALAWALVRKVIDRLDDEQLGLLGAGQLENIFREEGEVFFPLMAAAAREDPRVAEALSNIWAYDAPLRPQLSALLRELGIAQG